MGERALVAAVSALVFTACSQSASSSDFSASSPELTGHVFAQSATCDGGNILPTLHWAHAPSGTISFVIEFVDSDTGGGEFTQWLLYDLPPGTFSIDGALPSGSVEGYSELGRRNYVGPCPERGTTQHYRFHVVALDQSIRIDGLVDRFNLERLIAGHILGRADIAATDSR